MTKKTISVSNPTVPSTPSAGQPRAARIAITHVDGRRETRSLDLGCHVVGRTEGSILLAEDAGVSRRHAQIDVRADRVTVVDLGSTRGTFDDDGTELTESHVLAVRQGFRVGKTRIVLLNEPSQAISGEQATAETKPAMPAALRARQSLAPEAAAGQAASEQHGGTASPVKDTEQA